LEQAADRLEALERRSSPMMGAAIKREVVAVRAACQLVEGHPCEVCDGKGMLQYGTDTTAKRWTGACSNCGGSGDL
jgi:hypothetical protein